MGRGKGGWGGVRGKRWGGLGEGVGSVVGEEVGEEWVGVEEWVRVGKESGWGWG